MASIPQIEFEQRIDLICDRFESTWKSGVRPDLQGFFNSDPEVRSEQLLLELLQVDMHYRRRRGEAPDASDYIERFSDYSDAIARLSTADVVTAALETDADEIEGVPATARRRVGGRYELVKQLGSGGFGTVWRSWDANLRRWVAVKLARVGDSPEVRASFQREARAMAALDHPHVVRVIDFGIEATLAYIVAELIDGTSLSEQIKSRRLAYHQALECLRQLTLGVEHFHERGVVHRDIKPANLLLRSDGQVIITDFGLARLESSESTLINPGEVVGSFPYMSPEQVEGHRVDRSTDLYACGVTMYQMLAGRVPFQGTKMEIRRQILQDRPVPLHELHPDIPVEATAVCLKAMARDPRDRYPDAAAFRADIEALQAGREVDPRGRSIPRRMLDDARMNRRTLLLGAGLFGAVGAAQWLVNSVSASSTAVPVLLQTDPPGAKAVIYPMDKRTWRPDFERRIVVGAVTPTELELEPGDYLVVAHLDDGRFHEVYRRVHALDDTGLKWGHLHLLSELRNGRCELPVIELHKPGRVAGLVPIPALRSFAHRPHPDAKLVEALRVPAFLVAQYEFTQGQRRDIAPNERRRFEHVVEGDRFPLREEISFDRAVQLAELCGGRLLTDVEYCVVATNGGQTRYPWGEVGDVPAAGEEPGFHPVGIPDWDRTRHTPPVYGLCTGLAEWIDAMQQIVHPTDDDRTTAVKQIDPPVDHFGIKGLASDDAPGDSDTRNGPFDPLQTSFRQRTLHSPDVGFRMARSARPRLKAEDFVRPVAKPS
ncbi:MAG: serine/threonine-protein kinase [Planctomycetaceae bacterium]